MLISSFPHQQWTVAQTDGEFDFCGPCGGRSKGPAAIESCTQRRPLQRPDEVLPQHGEASGGEGWCTVKLDLVVDVGTMFLRFG